MRQRIRVIGAMILREMTTRYGRSALGYVWAIVEPIAYIALFTLIFQQVTRDPSIGRSFPLFFATGVIAFQFYRDVADVTSLSFEVNRPLFTFPQVTILDALLSRFLLQFLTNCVVGAVIFTAIYMLEGLRPQIDAAPILLAILLAVSFGFGVGTMNCVLFVLYPGWQRVFNIIHRPLFLISGIFFVPESLPPGVRDLVLINPVIHIVGLFRKGFFLTYDAVYVSFPLLITASVGTLVFGLVLMRRNEGRLQEL